VVRLDACQGLLTVLRKEDRATEELTKSDSISRLGSLSSAIRTVASRLVLSDTAGVSSMMGTRVTMDEEGFLVPRYFIG